MEGMDNIMADDLAVNLQVWLHHGDCWVAQLRAGLEGHTCIFFGSLVTVDVELFNYCQWAVGFLVLVTFDVYKVGCKRGATFCGGADLQIDISVIVCRVVGLNSVTKEGCYIGYHPTVITVAA